MQRQINAPGEAQKSSERFTVIKNVITAMAPDILFVVEVNSGEGPESVLAAGESGIEGTKSLLKWLRTLDPNWRLVPPLKVGGYAKTESAGVFYRGQTGSIGAISPDPISGAAVRGTFRLVRRMAGTPPAPEIMALRI